MAATLDMVLFEVGYVGAPPRRLVRSLAVEHPVAIEVNGVAYAVMMATPADLDDFAAGFALSEGMIASVDELADVSVAEAGQGTILRLALSADRAAPMLERIRMRMSEGSCGLCGLESLEEVLRPLPRLAQAVRITPAAVERALIALGDHQTDGTRTGAMHAAAYCTADGAIVQVREDVGRHNALDKLIGALARAKIDPAKGFILVTARCSYELVEKTVRARCPALVAISAPTSLAVERAKAAGLQLIALARRDTMLALDGQKEHADGL